MSFLGLVGRKSYRLEHVFTPTSAARLTYVSRTQIDSDLRRDLTIPGLQVVLYGHSGGG